MKKNITMKDIATKLNISTVTVSKALTDKEGVGDELRRKIKELADEMGYRYNSLARDMKEGKSSNIGIIVSERFMKEYGFYMNAYGYCVKALAAHNYYGIMEIISTQMEADLVVPNVLRDNKVDGLIMLGQVSAEYLHIIKASSLHFVQLDFYNEREEADAILSDNLYGSYVTTNYLVELGHKKIGFVGNKMATSSILDRYLGYYKALLENDLSFREEWIIKDRNINGEFVDLILPDTMPTAFVCNCDEVAYHLVRKLKNEGYIIPEDVSVVGFDNFIYSTLSSPAITTFEVDMKAMAEIAVETIVKRIEKPSQSNSRKVVSGKIIIRDSCAPPRNE